MLLGLHSEGLSDFKVRLFLWIFFLFVYFSLGEAKRQGECSPRGHDAGGQPGGEERSTGLRSGTAGRQGRSGLEPAAPPPRLGSRRKSQEGITATRSGVRPGI